MNYGGKEGLGIINVSLTILTNMFTVLRAIFSMVGPLPWCATRRDRWWLDVSGQCATMVCGRVLTALELYMCVYILPCSYVGLLCAVV